MKIFIDDRGVIMPEGALTKIQFVGAEGKDKGGQVDSCSECKREVKITTREPGTVFHICGADAE